MSSSPLGGSHGLALAATAMALSGTIIFISLCRSKPYLPDAAPSSSSPAPLRPCISYEKRRREPARRKGKKRVRFAEDVVDNGAGRPREAAGPPPAAARMPANREALYRGMLRDRSMHRVACSY